MRTGPVDVGALFEQTLDEAEVIPNERFGKGRWPAAVWRFEVDAILLEEQIGGVMQAGGDDGGQWSHALFVRLIDVGTGVDHGGDDVGVALGDGMVEECSAEFVGCVDVDVVCEVLVDCFDVASSAGTTMRP